MQRNPTTNDYVTLQQNSRAVYMQSKMAAKYICDICFQPGKRGRMNDGYFAFTQQSYKKLTNLERA